MTPGDLLDLERARADHHEAVSRDDNAYWRCGNGHTTSLRFQRCGVCDSTVFDDDPDYSDDEVRRS